MPPCCAARPATPPWTARPALKAAIIAKFERENGLRFSPNEIIVSNGAKQVIYNAFMATLAPGDEVILPTPCWVSYGDMTLLAEGVPVTVPCPQNHGFKLRPGGFGGRHHAAHAMAGAERARQSGRRRLSPSRAGGAGRRAAQHPQVGVMTDDIYEHIIFDGLEFHSFAAVAPDLRDRTLTINGVSKAYAMTGWRIGYAGGPATLIRAMAKMQAQSSGCPGSVSQAAAVAALSGPQDYIADRAAAFQYRRDTIVALLETIPGLTCFRPEGAFYLYIGCAGLLGRTRPDGRVIKTDEDVALHILEHGRVTVVQGAAYGLSP